MAIWELLLRSQHRSHLIPLSARFPDLPILEWWLWRQEILKVDLPAGELFERFRADLKELGLPLLKVDSNGSRRLFFLDHTGHERDSLWSDAYRYNILQAPPMVYLNGWGYYRLLGIEEEGIQEFVSAVGRTSATELLGKKRLPLDTLPSTVWSQQLFGNLTPRQTETILRAAEAGYFRSPRRVKAAELARGIGLGRTTFEEHLRKAENQLISNLVPYLRIHMGEVEPTKLIPALLAAWGVEDRPRPERGGSAVSTPATRGAAGARRGPVPVPEPDGMADVRRPKK